MWLMTYLSLAWATPPQEAPDNLGPLLGTWQVDWGTSTGVDAMLAAQGVPGVVRAVATRAKVKQEVGWTAEGALLLRRHLPIGSVTEELRVDGAWQELDSRLGDHEVRITPSAAGLSVERVFADYTLTEKWSLADGALVNHRVLVHRDGRTLESTLRMLPLSGP